MAKPNKRKSLVQRLENPSNPSGRLDVLTYGLMNRIINEQAVKYGIPTESLGGIKDPLAKIASEVSNRVREYGIAPDLVGIGLLAAISLYQRYQNEGGAGRLEQTNQRNSDSNVSGNPSDGDFRSNHVRTDTQSTSKVDPRFESERRYDPRGRGGRF